MYTLYLYTEDAELREKYLTASFLAGDAGVDLYCPISAPVHHMVFLNHMIRCRMTYTSPEGVERDVSYYLYPRSSLSKTPLRLANSVGIIDSGYRGEIVAAFDVNDSDGYTLEKHQRLVQICSPTLEKVRLVVVDQLELQTERGSGGFGSTGK
jgi:dUTP pyrophosphatase